MHSVLTLTFLIALLTGPDSSSAIAYDVDVAASRLQVKTYKGGLLSGLGHSHVVRATDFDGVIRFDPKDPKKSSIDVSVPVKKLELADEVSDSDRKKILSNMHKYVLKTERAKKNETIRFVSTKFDPVEDGFEVTGNLTLAGVTKPVKVEMRVRRGRTSIKTSTKFDIKQTDFGIKPFSAALGTIRVANRVSFDIDLVGKLASDE